MLNKFDYAEPACPLCDGKQFYAPDPDAPEGRIPVGRIIERVDACLARNDTAGAERLLLYWRDEAVALRDRQGELSMESELVGHFRKINDRARGLSSVERALALIEALGQGENPGGATILINCATAYKAFGMAAEAMALYRRAEAVYSATLAPTDPRFGGLYNNMALALADLARFDEAEAAYRAALAVMEQTAGGEAEAAITYVNLAHLCEQAGQADRIPACMARAWALLASEHLPHDGNYAFVIEKCAPSFGYFGDEAAYAALMKEAKRIYAGA